MKPITQDDLDKISEYVFKGINASKAGDSQFWGGIEVRLAVFAEEMKEMKKAMEYYAIEKKLQNGRVSKLENWRSYIVGGLSLMAFLSAFAFYGYTYEQSNQKELINNLASQIQSRK